MKVSETEKIEAGKKQLSGFKVAFYLNVLYVIIRVLFYFFERFEIPKLEIVASLFLQPLYLLNFNGVFLNIVFAIISGCMALFFFFLCIGTNVKYKFIFYCISFIFIYIVHIGTQFFWRVSVISSDNFGIDANIPSIVFIFIGLIGIFLLFVFNYLIIASSFDEYLNPESDEYKNRIEKEKEIERLRLINERERKEESKRLEKERIIEKQKEKRLQKEGRIFKEKKDDKKSTNGFSENKELAAKIRNKVLNTSTDTILTFDTNIMIKTPLLIKDLSDTYKIVISKMVFDELDRKKTDNSIGANARTAMRIIENILIEGKDFSIVPVEDSFLLENGLNPNKPDDVIVGTCLKQKTDGVKIVFISEDRGARILALNHKLEVISL